MTAIKLVGKVRGESRATWFHILYPGSKSLISFSIEGNKIEFYYNDAKIVPWSVSGDSIYTCYDVYAKRRN